MADKVVKIYGDARFLPRHDTLENWQTKNPILLEAEPSYVIDDEDGKKIKFGDGVTPWNDLPYFPSSVEVDQTYSPTSENAQSGKAVAEAVAIEENRADNTFANALKGSKSGSAILIDDISPVTHEMGVRIRGKNLIPYPYAETTKTLNGLTFTINDNGTITVNAEAVKALADTVFEFTSLHLYPKGTYIMSGCPTGGSTSTYFLNAVNANGAGYTMFLNDIGSGKKIVLNKNDTLKFSIHIKKDTVVKNLIFKPQLELGTTATNYTPYVPDLTAVKVKKCGKNLLSNLNYIEPQNLKTEIGYSKKIHLKAGFSYTFSIASISNATYWRFAAHIYENGIMVSVGDNNLQSADWFTGDISMYGPKNQNYFLSHSNQTVLENITYIITALKDCEICFGLYMGDTSVDTICNNVQIELGTTSTEYEPYITPTEYTPNADGTVEGVTSLYPNTTLMTDTGGVIIDCEYNRDINKAFAALEAAIATNNS